MRYVYFGPLLKLGTLQKILGAIMVINKKIISFIGIFISIFLISPAMASCKNFNCPHPSQIESTDFTVPSIWVAPPVVHSLKDAVGIGLGGKEVKEFLGAEEAIVNHKNGWVCIYKSAGGISVQAYRAKILSMVESNRYLKKYQQKITRSFDEIESYLIQYPVNEEIGFIGYQMQQ